MRIDDVLEVAAALEREQVRYALFGAMAMAVHGVDRATRDIDLFVAADSDNVERLRRALQRVFDDPEIDTPAMLYEMKRGTVRGRDRDDAERIRRAFDLEDG